MTRRIEPYIDWTRPAVQSLGSDQERNQAKEALRAKCNLMPGMEEGKDHDSQIGQGKEMWSRKLS